VSLPRLGAHADEVQAILERRPPDNVAGLQKAERRAPGEEGLATLAALPAQLRPQAIAQV
jgi:hypothetical protein